jgi:hypothetical protein
MLSEKNRKFAASREKSCLTIVLVWIEFDRIPEISLTKIAHEH